MKKPRFFKFWDIQAAHHLDWVNVLKFLIRWNAKIAPEGVVLQGD